MINQVFILAAGQGSRMRPLTDNIPKPLIKVNGRSMLDRILDKVSTLAQIKKIVINGFYLADQLEAHLNSLNNPKIIFSKETEKLETGGGLLKALPLFDQDQPILIINGDIVWQETAALNKIIAAFDERNTDILLGIKAKEELLGYEGNGDFNFDEKTGELTRSENNDFVYAGIHIFHPRILKKQNLPPSPFSLSYFFKDAAAKGIRLKGIKLVGKFFHIGTENDLKKYQNFVDKQ